MENHGAKISNGIGVSKTGFSTASLGMQMYRLYFLVLISFLIVACGPAKIYRETYEALPYDKYDDGKRRVYLGIDATRKVTSWLPFYYSDVSTEPYELMIMVHSELSDTELLVIERALIVFPDETEVDLAVQSTEVSCRMSVTEWNNNFNSCAVFLPFGSQLKYREDFRFTAEVEFSFSDGSEVKVLKIEIQNIKTLDRGTTFDVLMSV